MYMIKNVLIGLTIIECFDLPLVINIAGKFVQGFELNGQFTNVQQVGVVGVRENLFACIF